MIPVKRMEQTEDEYMRELDGLLVSMQQLVKSDGWKRMEAQLATEKMTAWLKMANAETVDGRALASTEYMVLARVLEAPGLVMQRVSQTMMAKPLPERRGARK